MLSKDEKIYITILILLLIICTISLLYFNKKNKNSENFTNLNSFINPNNIHIIYLGSDLISQKEKDLKYPSDDILINLEKIIDKNKNKLGNFTIHKFYPLLDSSNISQKEWNIIGNYIVSIYDKYDSFVIIHGTDTITYTGSGLSFMFENLSKPIILTGYNESVDTSNNNLSSTLKYASFCKIPEVVIIYNDKVYRACRSTKIRKGNKEEFISNNFNSLGFINKNFDKDCIKINDDLCLKHDNTKETTLKIINPSINCIIVKLFPGITGNYIKSLITNSKINAIIFELYGNGNIPTDNDFLNVLYEINNKNSNILLVGVCNTSLNTLIGNDLKNANFILLNNTTTESAYAKILMLMSQYQDINHIKEIINIPIRGES